MIKLNRYAESKVKALSVFLIETDSEHDKDDILRFINHVRHAHTNYEALVKYLPFIESIIMKLDVIMIIRELIGPDVIPLLEIVGVSGIVSTAPRTKAMADKMNKVKLDINGLNESVEDLEQDETILYRYVLENRHLNQLLVLESDGAVAKVKLEHFVKTTYEVREEFLLPRR